MKITSSIEEVLSFQKQLTSKHEDLGKSVNLVGAKFQNVERVSKNTNPFGQGAQKMIEDNTT